ncbi:hypothetical protein BH10ACI2_BH10ACI2_10400 [soil metagenome]
MPFERSKSKDLKSLLPPLKRGGRSAGDQPNLRPTGVGNEATTAEPQNLVNLHYSYGKEPDAKVPNIDSPSPPGDEEAASARPGTAASVITVEAPSANSPSVAKKAKRAAKDEALLVSDRWLVRNGHSLTFIGLYLFSVMVLFRPYEIVPGLGFLSATAFYFAVATIAIYLPSQIVTESNVTMLSTEVKAVVCLTLIALITIPIAKDVGLAWEKFNDSFIKAVVIFIVFVNVVRTRSRLMHLMWLSLGIGVYLSIAALDLYMRGQFTVENYRVGVDVGGMFGNPNEMALHFVMMMPIALTLGIAAKNKLARIIYFAMTALFAGANMVTYSRGGFIGMLAIGAVLAWKLGRRQRITVSIASIVIGGLVLVAAPGNYALRMLSIFIPSLDPVGSSGQRQELLERSIQVTLRNPWGLGIGCFPIVSIHNLQTHNAYTQVSTELGILGLAAYLVFMISPFRKLGAIERKLFDAGTSNWFYYFSIGLQASLVGYMVTSFFAAVAYNWFIYYMIAYAVAFRRIYSLECESKATEEQPSWDRQIVLAT